MRTIDEQGYHFEEWFTPEEIAKDVKQVAKKISKDYQGKEPLFVVVLNGAFVFASDLLRALDNVRCEVTFIRVSSYWGMSSTGKLEFIVPLQQVVENRDVVIVEDIVDTGITMYNVLPLLENKGAASIKIACLLQKPEKLQVDLTVDYCAMEIPNDFIVGYGLDYDGFGRNYKDIYTLAK